MRAVTTLRMPAAAISIWPAGSTNGFRVPGGRSPTSICRADAPNRLRASPEQMAGNRGSRDFEAVRLTQGPWASLHEAAGTGGRAMFGAPSIPLGLLMKITPSDPD